MRIRSFLPSAALVLLGLAALAAAGACGDAPRAPQPIATSIPDATPRPEPGLTMVLAPVEAVSVERSGGESAEYVAVVRSGLPDACNRFAGYQVKREGTAVYVLITNSRPEGGQVACAQVHGTIETRIPLGSDFAPGPDYLVDANGVQTTFTPGGTQPGVRPTPPSRSSQPGTAYLTTPFSLALGQTVEIPEAGVVVTFDAVTEDSRCPVGVACIWAGQVSIQLRVSLGGGPEREVTLTLGPSGPADAAAAVDGFTVTVRGLAPVPAPGQPAPKYVATLMVTPGAGP